MSYQVQNPYSTIHYSRVPCLTVNYITLHRLGEDYSRFFQSNSISNTWNHDIQLFYSSTRFRNVSAPRLHRLAHRPYTNRRTAWRTNIILIIRIGTDLRDTDSTPTIHQSAHRSCTDTTTRGIPCNSYPTFKQRNKRRPVATLGD